ncbi:MAG: flagellar biosynthesis anti-sigma factor FlgM [Pseudomonadota bacterium]
MPNKIDSTLATYRQAKSTQDRTRAGNENARVNPNAGAPASDTVDVTASGRELAALESAIRSADVSDARRVDAVKARIADGTYEVDAQRVADNLLSMDQALPLG